MNRPPCVFDLLEAGLERLRVRCPDAPVTGILLCRLLQCLGRGMAEMFEQQLRPFGLAEAEFRVLMTLFTQADAGAHPGELCASTSQRPANMSRICDALVSRDLITRTSSARDRRRLVLRITARGEELVRSLLPGLFAPLRELLAEIPQAKQQQLILDLKSLCAQLDAVPTLPAPERVE